MGWTRVAARCFVGRERVVDGGEPLGGGEVGALVLLEGGEERVQVGCLQARLRTRLRRLRAPRSRVGAGRRRRRRGAQLEEQRRVCRHALCGHEAVCGRGKARVRWRERWGEGHTHAAIAAVLTRRCPCGVHMCMRM